MKVPLGGGAYLEPDSGPRGTRYHKRIVRCEKVEGYRAVHNIVLECGHHVETFGDLRHSQGVILCTACRDLEQGEN